MLFHGKLHQLASYHTILYTGHQATRTCASSYIMRGPNLCDEMTTSFSYSIAQAIHTRHSRTFRHSVRHHPVATYYFPLAQTFFSFAHTFSHNSHHYLFWKDNNWHHYFMKRKERHVLFFENKWNRCLMHGRKTKYVYVACTSPLVMKISWFHHWR